MGEENTIKNLYENYLNIEKSIVKQLLLEVSSHRLTQGSYRENVWREMFEQIIPKKFCIDQGVFIIDSHGKISKEVDLAIFDEQYTPYIFNYGKIKFIPIEAVSVVIQCKSDSLNNKILYEWTESINKLETSLESVARFAQKVIYNEKNEKNTQSRTRPIKILCSTYHKKNQAEDNIMKMFDICINIDTNLEYMVKSIKNEEWDYYEWYNELNNFKTKNIDKDDDRLKKKISDLKIVDENNKENVILSLIFQLNQLLMLINNPMLFPHEAYARMFRERCCKTLDK